MGWVERVWVGLRECGASKESGVEEVEGRGKTGRGKGVVESEKGGTPSLALLRRSERSGGAIGLRALLAASGESIRGGLRH